MFQPRLDSWENSIKSRSHGVPHQQLPLNVHRNTKLLHMDKDKGDDDFQVELQSSIFMKLWLMDLRRKNLTFMNQDNIVFCSMKTRNTLQHSIQKSRWLKTLM